MVWRGILGATLLATAVSANAAEVTVVNGTGSPITAISVRSYGASDWQSIQGALSAGASRSISAPGETCAFDIRGKLTGGAEAVWSNVNFCETRSVTLNRRADGTAWADYD